MVRAWRPRREASGSSACVSSRWAGAGCSFRARALARLRGARGRRLRPRVQHRGGLAGPQPAAAPGAPLGVHRRL
eukprot:5803263-Alexandrium_andersonii.AAC.1